jgi:hypothetical protein
MRGIRDIVLIKAGRDWSKGWESSALSSPGEVQDSKREKLAAAF